MAKGNPNDDSLKLESTPKFLDKDGSYKPFYIAPDATDKKRGDVFLSDATNSSDNAATSVTAATPAAVKAANDNANTRLSRTSTAAQTVAGEVTFNSTIHAIKQIDGSINGKATKADKLATGREITLKTKNNDKTKATGTFDGSQNIVINIEHIDARAIDEGMLPLKVIPQGALDRLVKVANKAARFNLTTDNVQEGDSVLQIDTGVMYIVVNEKSLNSENGYQEYKAGTALEASHAASATKADSATKATTADTAAVANKLINAVKFSVSKGSVNGIATTEEISFDGSTAKTVAIDNRIYDNFKVASATANGGSGLVPAPAKGEQNKFLRGDGTWQVAGEVTGVKGDKEADYRVGKVNITAANVGALPTSGGTLTGNVTMIRDVFETMGYTLTASATGKSISFIIGSDKTNRGLYDRNSNKWMIYADANNQVVVNGKATSAGSADSATLASKLNKTLTLAGNVSGSVNLGADGETAKVTTKINNDVIATNMIQAGAVTTDKIADGSIDTKHLQAYAVTNAKLGLDSVQTGNIRDDSVTLAKLKHDVGTVYVGSEEPTDEHVKIWVQV